MQAVYMERKKLMEVLPKSGLVFSEKGMLTGVLCKPKVLPLKSITLEKIEAMEKKLLESLNPS